MANRKVKHLSNSVLLLIKIIQKLGEVQIIVADIISIVRSREGFPLNKFIQPVVSRFISINMSFK